LKWFAKIPAKNIRATLKEIEKQISILGNLGRRPPSPGFGATRHAVPPERQFYCVNWIGGAHGGAVLQIHAWQQARATGKHQRRNGWRENGIRELRKLGKEFNAYWPARNKATPRHCMAFLKWRIRIIQNPPRTRVDMPCPINLAELRR